MTGGTVETRTAKIALVTVLSTVLSVALQLVSVPLCLRFWGNEAYGLWLALLALFSLIRTFDSGFAAYVGNELNLQYHRDQLALRRTLASAVSGAVLVGCIQLAAGSAILAAGALADLLGVPEPVARHARGGLALAVLLAGWVLIGPYLGVVHRLLIPAGMLYEATWWLMGVQVTQAGAVVAAAGLGLDIAGTAVLFSAAQLGIYVASALYIARKLPGYFPWWKGPSWLVGVRDFWRSTVMVGANFLIQAGTNGLVMLVASGLGAAAVPAFTTVRTLTNLWTTLGNVLTSPLLPEVVRYHAQRDGSKLHTTYEAHLALATTAVNASIVVIFPFLDALYRHWTGGRVPLDGPLLCWLLLSIAVGTPGALIVQYLTGINALRSVTLIFAARGLLPLVLGLGLLPTLGLPGIGVALVFGELAGPLCLGTLLFRRQLAGLGVRSRTATAIPMALGTLSVAIFLTLRAMGGPHADVVHGAALAGVLGSAIWGWSRVDAEVRARALRLIGRRSAA